MTYDEVKKLMTLCGDKMMEIIVDNCRHYKPVVQVPDCRGVGKIPEGESLKVDKYNMSHTFLHQPTNSIISIKCRNDDALVRKDLQYQAVATNIDCIQGITFKIEKDDLDNLLTKLKNEGDYLTKVYNKYAKEEDDKYIDVLVDTPNS